MGKPEGRVENYLIKRAKQENFLHYKFTSPSNNGVPDRVIIGHGLTVFVELKAPGETPRKLQDVVMADMRAHGADVHAIDTKDGIDELFETLKPRYVF